MYYMRATLKLEERKKTSAAEMAEMAEIVYGLHVIKLNNGKYLNN